MRFSIALDQVFFDSETDLRLITARKIKWVVDTESLSGTVSKLQHTSLRVQLLLDFQPNKVKLPGVSKVNCLKHSGKALNVWLKLTRRHFKCFLPTFGQILVSFPLLAANQCAWNRTCHLHPCYDFNLSPSYW